MPKNLQIDPQQTYTADTVRFADIPVHAYAAASMRHIGTTDAMTGWSDCLALAGEYGWRPSPG